MSSQATFRAFSFERGQEALKYVGWRKITAGSVSKIPRKQGKGRVKRSLGWSTHGFGSREPPYLHTVSTFPKIVNGVSWTPDGKILFPIMGNSRDGLRDTSFLSFQIYLFLVSDSGSIKTKKKGMWALHFVRRGSVCAQRNILYYAIANVIQLTYFWGFQWSLKCVGYSVNITAVYRISVAYYVPLLFHLSSNLSHTRFSLEVPWAF